jgi:hypothetical protein
MRQVVVTAPPEAYADILAVQTDRFGPSETASWSFPTSDVRLEKGTRLTLTRK